MTAVGATTVIPSTTSAPSSRSWWARLRRVADELDASLAELDPECCDAQGALELLSLCARIRRAGAAAEAIMARRVDECRAHRTTGHRSTAHLLAEIGGTTVGQAHAVVETGKALADRPATAEALRAGSVSVEQAQAVTTAAAVAPDAEGDLLARAGSESLRRLRERARHVRLAAEDDRLGRYRRQHEARSLRHGVDDDGMGWGHWRLPPDRHAAVVNRLERQADREFKTARAEGRRDDHDRYLADALVALTTDGGDGPAARDLRTDVVLHVSYDAFRRARVEDAELCIVQGTGPVPVERAYEALSEGAFLKGVLVDGTDVRKVKHFGRHRPADLQTALEARAVLVDGDVACAVDDCDQRLGPEWDDAHPVADGGPTSYDNLQPLCRHHHREKGVADARPAGRPAEPSVDGDDRAPP